MDQLTTSAFVLPDHLAAKADAALIGDDEERFAAIAESLAETIADLSERLAEVRQRRGGSGQGALERDQEVHRLSARLRALRRFGLDLCLGHMVPMDGSGPVYIGRLGLKDHTGRQLLVDWRAPAAEPFFGATHGNPMGLARRRRYRWARDRVVDYWDEVFTAEGLEGIERAALDDQSSFIASLGEARSAQMRDVLATIQADQDAIIRAGSRGPLVVDGGPGTGKTVVALHRSAYLLYADPRLGHRRGGVLFIGPHEPYLDYVSDVLPSLGEEGVQACTLRDLVPEGARAADEVDAEVARLKAGAEMVAAIEPAVRLYEEPPREETDVETPWAEVRLSVADWQEAFRAPAPGTPHNEARADILDELVSILVDKHEDVEASLEQIRCQLRQNEDLTAALNRAWPLLEPTDIVADLWSVPAYLRRCAPWLSVEQVRQLQRADAQAWTNSDLPLLDAARQRLGDPRAWARRRRTDAALAAQQEEMARVVDHLIETDDSEMRIMSMLRGQDLAAALVDESAAARPEPDLLAGPFAHVVVDEAQELTDAEWQMVLSRCPSRSLTIVGDRAQARRGFTETWQGRLGRVGLSQVRLASLSINYRTPAEVMAEAEPVIRAAIPDANVPTSVRESGMPVLHGSASERDALLERWLATHEDGIAVVIGDPSFAGLPRVRSMTPSLAKGLEFDLVVLVDPQSFGAGIEAAVDRYVSMTRATGELAILTSG